MPTWDEAMAVRDEVNKRRFSGRQRFNRELRRQVTLRVGGDVFADGVELHYSEIILRVQPDDIIAAAKNTEESS